MGKKKKSKKGYVVGVDLGGTKILTAVVDKKGRILSRVKRATRATSGADKIVERIVQTVHQAIQEADIPAKKVVAVGVGAPAPIDPQTGFAFQASNIPALSNFPLGERLQETLQLPVFVDNDVNVGTVGEYAWGAGRGTKDMVGIFVGTGVGGGLIVGGKLRHGFRNSAGEVGHMVVGFKDQPDEVRCGCGRRGCLEAYASRTAIERDVQAAVAAGRETLLLELMEKKGKRRITSGVLAQALEAQDPLMIEVLDRVTTYLSLLVATIANFFDPEMFVIGGGVAEALGERLIAPIRHKAPRWFIKESDAAKVCIVLAELGDDAGVLGAATIARMRLK